MSRPTIDPEWEELLARFRTGNVIPITPADEDRNQILVEEWRTGETIFHGCSIPPASKPRAEAAVWLCKFFLAGQQRTIARGTLLQCAKLYDAALIHFAEYRTKSKRPEFNFGRDAATIIAKSEPVHGYFCSLAALLKRRNEFLRTGEQKRFDRLARVSQRQHDTRTAAGRIEKRLSEIESKLHSLDANTAAVNRVELLVTTILHMAQFGFATPADSQNFAKQILTGQP